MCLKPGLMSSRSASAKAPPVKPAVAAHVPAVHATHAQTPATGGDDCKIPYTIGPDGERIYKRQCFK